MYAMMVAVMWTSTSSNSLRPASRTRVALEFLISVLNPQGIAGCATFWHLTLFPGRGKTSGGNPVAFPLNN